MTTCSEASGNRLKVNNLDIFQGLADCRPLIFYKPMACRINGRKELDEREELDGRERLEGLELERRVKVENYC